MLTFEPKIEIIGANPFVFVPQNILQSIFEQAGKSKGTIPIRGTINDKPYKQTLVRYSGHWRLYINISMLKNSPKHLGEQIHISVEFDPESRVIQPPELFIEALNKNQNAKAVFDSLSTSRKNEIVRYLARLKSIEILEKNIAKAVDFLLGNTRFIGRDKP